MVAKILNIGDELLIGKISNTNAAYLARELTFLGFEVKQILVVADEVSQILTALEKLGEDSDLVIVTGGLGPTTDDKTRRAIAQFFSQPLVYNQLVIEDIKAFWRAKQREMSQADFEQALVPAQAVVLRNHYGTAPGIVLEKSGVKYVFLPGVPHEMRQLFENELKPLLKNWYGLGSLCQEYIHTLGLPESQIAEKLAEVEQELTDEITIEYLPSPEDILITLWSREQSACERIRRLSQKIVSVLGREYVWGTGKTGLVERIQARCIEMGCTLSTAESCTGGNIAHMITSVAGSSAYFLGGVVSYANSVKSEVLGVSAADLERYGAVSEQVVRQMAEGVRRLVGSTYSVATSGIAGPSGGSQEKPVGTVWIAISGPKHTVAKVFHFGTLREFNIRRASAMGLFMLWKEIRD